MKRASLILLAFAVTLAWVIGTRLSNEAAAILAGAFIGVAASIPFLLLLLSSLNDARRETPQTMILPPSSDVPDLPPVVNIWIIHEPENAQVPQVTLPRPRTRQLPPPQEL